MILVYSFREEDTQLTSGDSQDSYSSWSPDGKRIVFVSDRSGANDIWVMNSDGKDLIQLTNDPYQDIYPFFSPDGTKIAFTSGRSGGQSIWIMNSEGSNSESTHVK